MCKYEDLNIHTVGIRDWGSWLKKKIGKKLASTKIANKKNCQTGKKKKLAQKLVS